MTRRPTVAPHHATLATAWAARAAHDPGIGLELYSRFGTTLSVELEAGYAALYDQRWAVVTPSGMSALDLAVTAAMAQAGPEATLLIPDTLYVGTRRYLQAIGAELRHWQVRTLPSPVDPTSLRAWEQALDDGPAVCLVESLTMPDCRSTLVDELGERCQSGRDLLVVDATAAPPAPGTPRPAGDLIAVSATKFLSGTNDVLAGVVLGNADLKEWLIRYRRMVGCQLDDLSCARLIDSLASMGQRTTAALRNASLAVTRSTGARGLGCVASQPGRTPLVFIRADLDVVDSHARWSSWVDAWAAEFPIMASFGSHESTVTPLSLVDPDHVGSGILRLSCGAEDTAHFGSRLDAVLEGIGRWEDAR